MNSIDKFLKLYSYKFNKGYPDMNNKQDILLLESILKEDFGIVLEVQNLDRATLTKYVDDEKEKDKSGFKPKDRREILIKKIQGNEELELVDGSNFVVDNKEEVIKNLRGEIPKTGVELIDKDGNRITTSKLLKTKEFGGKDNVTAKQEAAKAMALALAFSQNSPITNTDIDINNISNLSNLSLGSENSIENLIKFLDGDKSWMDSTINTANELIKQTQYFTQGLGNYTSHWGDNFTKKIYKVLNDIQKVSKGSIVATMDSNKWNPSDIWVSTEKGRKTINALSQVEDIGKYNQIINDLFCKGDLIGISLKKSAKSAPKIKEFNTANCSLPQSITFKSFKTSPKKAGEEIIVDFGGKETKLDLRNFSVTKGFSGEMKGTEAQAGKVGISAINAIIDNLGISSDKLPSSSTTTAKIFKEKDSNPDYEAYKAKFKELYNEHIGGDFDSFFETATDAFKTGKFYALHFIDALDKAGDKQDEFISQIVRYGMSGVKGVSSSFIKSGA
tara:strand:+ start:497 stop:2005 length:1509 start_codon:yes stop_codon:yes gene_type:complete